MWTRLFDRLKAADPGALRLSLALRTVAATGLSLLTSYALVQIYAFPSMTMLLSVFVAMLSSIVISDPTPAAQRWTVRLMALPVAASFIVASLTAHPVWLGRSAMLVVVFLGVYARRFGPRGNAHGILAFMIFYLGLYLGLPLADLGPNLFSLGVGLAFTYMARFILLPDLPSLALRFSLMAMRSRAVLVLELAARCAATGRWFGRTGRLKRSQLFLLRDTVLMVEEQLAGEQVLEGRMLPLELAFERLISVSRSVTTAKPNPELAAALQQLAKEVRQPSRRKSWSLGSTAGATAYQQELLRLDGAALLRAAVQEAAWLAEARQHCRMPPVAAAAPAPSVAAQACQTTLACALAMGLGHLVSPLRWQWAVIAAFVVFIKSSTLADTVVRAWQRSIGTLIGVGLGYATVAMIQGSHYLQLSAVFACMFLAYYYMQLSYAWMAVLVTAMLAFLYLMLGNYSPQLLVVRLEETLVGAFSGALVAAFVLPASVLNEVRSKTAVTLRAVAAYLDGPEPSPVAATRRLDRQLQKARFVARSLDESLLARLVPRISLAVGALADIVYAARRLRLAPQQEPGVELGAQRQVLEALHGLADRLSGPSGQRRPRRPMPAPQLPCTQEWPLIAAKVEELAAYFAL